MCKNGARYEISPNPPLIKGNEGGFAVRALHRVPRTPYGFTLLEVIIALAILGIGFALAMELLATGVRSAKASEEYTQAVLLVRQKMAEIAVTPSLEGSTDAGEFEGGFRWASEIYPLPQEEDLPAQLYQVRVRVTWPGRRGEKALDLYTVRMAVNEKKLAQTRVVQ
jgi:general secretion pathway protein I